MKLFSFFGLLFFVFQFDKTYSNFDFNSTFEEFRVVYEWYKLDFSWVNDDAKSDAFINLKYVPKHNIISGVKIWKHLIFLTLPRWREGVPATIATVPSSPKGPSASPRLEPFPSWEWNALEEPTNCSRLRNVHSLEIDPDGVLWIIDTGYMYELSSPNYDCPPKLVMFDIEKNLHLSTYVFPDGVVSEDSVLSDIVVDPLTKTAYISDSSETKPGIIVFRDKKSYKVTGGITMHSDPSIGGISVNGTEVQRHQNIGSLALSLQDRVLYFSPITSYHLYSIPLSALEKPDDVTISINDLGRKMSPSSSMILDSKQILYFSLLENDAIVKWNSSKDPFTSGQHRITEDKALLQWISSFGFDDRGSLWLISNRFQTFLANTINLEVPNFRLIKAYTGSNSYLHNPRTNMNVEQLTKNSSSRNSYRFYFSLIVSYIVLIRN